MPAYGVNIDDPELAEWLEERRIRTVDGERKIVSRSQAVRECIETTRAITDLLEHPPADVAAGAYVPEKEGDVRPWARQLVLDALRYRAERSDG